MAPEIWTQHMQQEGFAHYGIKSDVFSVGMVALDMATLEQAARRDNTTLRNRIAIVSEKYSRDFTSWLSSCLAQEYDARPSLEEALSRAIVCRDDVTVIPGFR
eukprot:GILK01011692.1.p1 GENE.GILK01011692.1~~GILK01011692.1.p1  ORF type:complete len:103 (-),score=5.99 GILK01011692.1:100-408(-)